jgi:DNA polymerase III delta prime subunit
MYKTKKSKSKRGGMKRSSRRRKSDKQIEQQQKINHFLSVLFAKNRSAYTSLLSLEKKIGKDMAREVAKYIVQSPSNIIVNRTQEQYISLEGVEENEVVEFIKEILQPEEGHTHSFWKLEDDIGMATPTEVKMLKDRMKHTYSRITINHNQVF